MVVALASAQNPYHIQLQGAAAKEIGHQQILRRDRGKLRMLGSQLPNLRWVESGEVDTDGAGIIVIDKINQRLVKVCQFGLTTTAAGLSRRSPSVKRFMLCSLQIKVRRARIFRPGISTGRAVLRRIGARMAG